MMKLRYCYIIYLFSFVSATPYGYGTNAGAVAKAVATSSAFNDQTQLPLSIPVGSGFSGSFSKSSSSSYSSASSSSSSSSSSFSFGGASSSDVNKGINSETNCGAGGCQNHAPSSSAFGKSETSSGINTAATAINGLQKSECGFENCSGNNFEENQSYKRTKIPAIGHIADVQYSGCSFGACPGSAVSTISGVQSESVTGLEQVKSDSNTDSSLGVAPGCKGSECKAFGTNYKPNLTGSEKQKASNTENESINSFNSNSNDIPVLTNQAIPVDHAKYNLHNENVASESQSDCTSGGCGNLHTTIGFKQPAAFLETPKRTKPSSYDVPIHGAINTLQVDSPFSSHKNPSLLSHNVPSPNVGSSNCKTSNCARHTFIHSESTQAGIPYSQQFDSKYSNFGQSSKTAPVESSEGYKPNGYSFGGSSVISSQDGYYTSTKPHIQHSSATTTSNGFSGASGYVSPQVLKPSNEKQAVYTGGFGGPPGLLKPNEFNINSNFDTSQVLHPTTSKPNVDVKPSDQTLPIYTGSFGGSSGILEPNVFDTTKPVNSNGESVVTPSGFSDVSKPVVFGSPNQNFPTYMSSFNGPTGTLKPNEFSVGHSSVTVNPGSFSHVELNSNSKPNVDVKPLDQKLPTYTNGFFGTSESLKPNKLDDAKPSENANSNANKPNEVTKPIDFHTPQNHNLPNYTGGLSPPTGIIKPSTLDYGHSHGHVHPVEFPQTAAATTVKPLEQNIPLYTSGFGGPPGLLKPNEFDLTKPSVNANTETAAHVAKPVTFDKPLVQDLPAYTGGIIRPTGPTKPNHLNNDQPSIVINLEPATAVKPLNQNLPTYVGGFNGPSGLLKPSANVNAETVAHTQFSNLANPITLGKPTNQHLPSYTGGLSGQTEAVHTNQFNTPQHFVTSNSGIFSHTLYPLLKPGVDVKPSNQNLPTHVGGFGSPPEFFKPSEFISGHPFDGTNTAAVPANEKHTTQVMSLNKPSELVIPTKLDATANLNNGVVSHYDYSSDQKLSTSTDNSFDGSAKLDKPNKQNAGQSPAAININYDEVAQTERHPVTKPSPDNKLSSGQLPIYTGGFGGPSGLLDTSHSLVSANIGTVSQTTHSSFAHPPEKSTNLSTYTSNYDGSSELQKSNDLNTMTPLPNINDAPHLHTGFNVPSELVKSHDTTKNPISHYGSDTTSTTEVFGIIQPTGNNNIPEHEVSDYNSLTTLGLPKPNEISISKTTTVATANTNTPSVGTSKPIFDTPLSIQNEPKVNGGLTSSLDLSKPTYETVNKLPLNSEASTESNIGSPHDIKINFDVSSGSHPDYSKNLQENINKSHATHSTGLLPNELKISSSDNHNKDEAPSQHSEPSGLGTGLSSVAKAEAVAYSGGFGGPPGLLEPHDGGRLNSNVYSGKVLLASQSGDKYGKIDSNIGSTNVNVGTTNSDSSISGYESGSAGVGPSGLSFTKDGLENTNYKSIGTINKENILTYSKKPNNYASGSQDDVGLPPIAIAQASASASATASATSAAFGNTDNGQEKFTQSSDNKAKEIGGCGGGCGRGTYNGENHFDFVGSLSKPLYFGGWNSGLNAAGTSVKNTAGALSGARAFSAGGNYASSSATAHASSGYHTKGGYGK